uniref:Selenoprotein H n=1 Tax=Esox lucius TaxID=8010 RepID=A0A3P9ANW2_ESOLU
WIGRGTKRKASAEVEMEAVAVKGKMGKVEEDDTETVTEGQRVVIEHWWELSALVAAHPELTVVLNPQKPRGKSFEVILVKGEKEVCLWSGIKKGPPRKLKFPAPDVVVSALEEALKTE